MPAGQAVPLGRGMFQAAADSIDQGIVVFGPDLKIRFSNTQFTALAEYPEALGMPGTSIADGLRHDAERGVYGPGDPEAIVADLLAAPRTEQPYVFERRLNSGRLLEIRRSPMPDGGIVAIHSDITERGQAEDALKESEARYRSLIKGSIQGILIHRNFKPLMANDAWARIFGFDSVEQVLALDSILPLVPEHEQERFWEYAKARLRGEEAPSHFAYEAVRHDGAKIWVDNIVRVVDWDGGPAIQSMVIDITERKQAEEDLLESEAKFHDYAAAAADWFWE